MASTFKVGELLNKRSPISKTWINFDGTYTVEMYDDVVHYTDEGGQLRDINPMLSSESDTEDFQGTKVPFNARVPRVFANGYSIGDGNEELTFIPVNARRVKGTFDPGKPNEILYKTAWVGTDVKLEVTPNSLKETIILKSDKAPTTFRFRIEENLDAITLDNLQLAPAWLLDANGEYRDVSQELTIEGEKLFVTLQVDTEGLTFPIEVDPTIIVSNLTKNTNKVDNEVNANVPSNTYVNPVSVDLLSNDIRRIYSKYPDLIKGIPSDAKITSAKLMMYTSAFDGTVRVKAHAVSSDYNPDTLTWNSQPLISDNLVSPEVTLQVGSPSWTGFDITSIVQAKLDGTQVSAIVVKSSNTSVSGSARFDLTNNATVTTRPYVSIDFNAPPGKPVVTKPNGGETIAGSQAIEWTAASDIRDYTYEPFPYNDAIIYSNMISIGQSFVVPADNASLKRIALRVGVSNSGIAYKMSLYRTTIVNGYYVANRSSLIATGDVVLGTGSSPDWCYADLPSVAVTKGDRLAIVIEAKDGSSITYQMARTNTYHSNTNGCAMTSAGGAGFTGYDMDFLYRITYSAGESASQLKYNVQLTTNNGGSWKDIIPLSFTGATSQSYDFTNEPETSTAKVRIRAYDGVSYGDWDESNGVFSISHNDPPAAPDNLSPNGTIVDRSTTTRMSWRHNDPDGSDPQSKFELQWRLQTDSSWSVIIRESVNQYYDMPINTFPAGKIEWKVRTYDQGGLVGPFSNVVVFTAAGKPSTPIITSPTNNASLSDARPLVTWSHPNQVQYRVRVFRTSDTMMVFEETRTSTNKALSVSTALSNNTAYYIQVAIADSTGLWSDYARVDITIAYTQPNKPTVSVTTDNNNGSVSFSILNPFPTGDVPRTTWNDVYRKSGNGDWIKIARVTNPSTGIVSYTDRALIPGATELYKIRAVASNGAYMDSDQSTVIVNLKYVQLAVASNTLNYVTLRKREGGKEVTGRQAVSTDFVGRPYPLTEFGSNLNRSYDYRYKVDSWDDVVQIREFAQLGEAFLLRDNWGKKDYVTFNSVSIEEGRTFWYVSIQPIKVHYVEEIE